MQRVFTSAAAAALVALTATYAHAQTAGATDLYHVHFAKAAPGKARALGDAVKQPDTTTAMPEHFIALRHQQGGDWDYCVIQHLGTKTTIEAGRTPPGTGRDLRASHNDTIAAGPSWPEFAKALGLSDAAATAKSVYVVSVWSEVPGHRAELGKILREPQPSKVPVSRLVLQHMEGSPWTFLAIDRYNSWQDFAADQEADAPAAGATDGWSDIREHSSSHEDTIADRIYP